MLVPEVPQVPEKMYHKYPKYHKYLLSQKFVGNIRITLVTILYKKVTTLPINFLRGLSSQEIKKYYVNNFVE
jgi:hypothetical protein